MRLDSLTDALESLASEAGKHMEADMEQHQEEESMLANWGHLYFTESGREVR